MMQRRGGLVIQQLSQRLGGLRVYRELSRLLQVRAFCRLQASRCRCCRCCCCFQHVPAPGAAPGAAPAKLPA